MATRQKIIHLHAGTKGAPAASALELGEIAVNYTDGYEKLYIKNNAASPEVVGFVNDNDPRLTNDRPNPSSLTIQRNGATLVTYDGSSAKTADIKVPLLSDSYSSASSSVGLSQKGGNSLYNALVNGYASSSGSAKKLVINNEEKLSNCLQYLQTETQTSGNDLPSKAWYHVLKFNHSTGDTYYKRNLALDFHSNRIKTNYAEGNGKWKGDWQTVAFLSDIPSVSVVDNDSGNAVTDITASGHTITLSRGKNFSEKGHTHPYVPDSYVKLYTSDSTDANLLPNTQIYFAERHDKSNVPCDGTLFSVSETDTSLQLFGNSAKTEFYIRNRWSTFGTWKKLWHDGNFDPSTKANSSHKHDWSEINNKPSTATRWPSWSEITGIVSRGNEFNFIPKDYNGSIWVNYGNILGGTSTITNYDFGNAKGGFATITSNGFSKKNSNDNYALTGAGGHREIKTASGVTSTGYPSTSIPDLNFLSYWNGAYSSKGDSNLTYCAKGKFGTMAIKDASSYLLTTGKAADSNKLDGLTSSSYKRDVSKSYSTLSGTFPTEKGEYWYDLVKISDSNGASPMVCNVKAYAHSSMTFVATKGYSDHGNISILAYNNSSNGDYAYCSSVRMLSNGKIQIKINKPHLNNSTYVNISANLFTSEDGIYPNDTLDIDTTTYPSGGVSVICEVKGTDAKITSNGFVKNGYSDSYVLKAGGGAELESELSVAYSKDSDKLDGLHAHTERNNEANKVVRTDGNGYIQCGYINSSSGDEKNNSSPSYVWGTNGSDSYLRTYKTSALKVGSADVSTETFFLKHDETANKSYVMQYLQTCTQTAGNDLPTEDWYHVLKFNHGTGDTYYKRNLALDFHSNRIKTNYATGNGKWKGDWQTIAFLSDIPSKLKADGGNADTVDNEHASAFLHAAGDVLTGTITIPTGTSTLIDASGNGIMALNPTSWTGVSSTQGLAIGSTAHEMHLRSSGNNLYHYNTGKGTNYKILDKGNTSASVDGNTLTINIDGTSTTFTDDSTTLSGHYTPGGGTATGAGTSNLSTGTTVLTSITKDTKGHVTAVGLGKLNYPDISGKLDKTAKAADSDKLDGHDSSYFATVSSLGSYFKTSGGTISGSVTVTGSVTAGAGFFDDSDERLKDFENDVDVDLDKIKNLPKKYFYWKDKEKRGSNLEIGTSAQEVQKLYPEIVSEDEKGMLSVDYSKLSVIALKAVDMLNEKNSKLEGRIDELEKKYEKLMTLLEK